MAIILLKGVTIPPGVHDSLLCLFDWGAAVSAEFAARRELYAALLAEALGRRHLVAALGAELLAEGGASAFRALGRYFLALLAHPLVLFQEQVV